MEEPKKGKEKEASTSSVDSTSAITRVSSFTGQEQERNRTSRRTSGAGTNTSTGRNQLPRAFDLIHTISQGTEVIHSMVASIDGVLFTGSNNTIVREWDRGYQSTYFQSFSGPVNAFDVLYSGEFLYAFLAHEEGVITVWRSNDASGTEFRPVATLELTLLQGLKNMVLSGRAPRNAISCLCLSEDGDFIYSVSVDHTMSTWCIQDYVEYKLVDTICCHRGAINALAVGPSVVFSGSSDGVINMWKRELYGENQDKVRHLLIGVFNIQNNAVPVVINALVFRTINFHSGWLYAGSSDGKVRCWRNLRIDRETEKPEPEVMSFHKGGVTCLALCSSPIVFSGSMDGTICAWRRRNEDPDGGPSHTVFSVALPKHSGPVTCIAAQDDWSPDVFGPPDHWILYSASLDRTLKVWRVHVTAARGSNAQSRHQEEVELRRKISF